MDIANLLFTYSHHIAEFIAFMISLVYYRSFGKTFMKWLPLYLGIIFIVEICTMFIFTLYLNYIITIVEAVFYGFVFYNLIDNKIIRRVIVASVFLSEVCYVTSFLLSETDINKMAALLKALTIFGFLISGIALTYLYQIFGKQDTITKEPGFWIAFGVTTFFSGVSIVFSLYDLILAKRLAFSGKFLFHVVPRLLSVVLYGSFIVSILMCKRK
jgi:hypothetical protein